LKNLKQIDPTLIENRQTKQKYFLS